jgi:hypothetical protein
MNTRSCLLQVIAFVVTLSIQVTVIAEDWVLTFDQLCPNERSKRYVLHSNGVKNIFVKVRPEKEFRKVLETNVDVVVLDAIRKKARSFQVSATDANVLKKSASDVDVRYSITYAQNGTELELRWLAGQLKYDQALTDEYQAILYLLNAGIERGMQMEPDRTKPRSVPIGSAKK